MAKQFDEIEDPHRKFIEDQQMFFVGTAGPDGRVNLSPKGMDSLRILSPNRLIWLNYTGSGNETAGHILQVNRMTLMWCSFAQRPLILRAYGSARAVHPRSDDWQGLSSEFELNPGARQIFDMTVEMVQTSCGYAVPFMEFTGDRDVLNEQMRSKGDQGIHDIWTKNNQTTIDGAPTDIFGPPT